MQSIRKQLHRLSFRAMNGADAAELRKGVHALHVRLVALDAAVMAQRAVELAPLRRGK